MQLFGKYCSNSVPGIMTVHSSYGRYIPLLYSTYYSPVFVYSKLKAAVMSWCNAAAWLHSMHENSSPHSGLHDRIWLPLCSSRVFFLFFPSLEISPNFCHQYMHVSNMRVTAGNWLLMVHSTCHVSFDCQRYGNMLNSYFTFHNAFWVAMWTALNHIHS